MSAPTLRPATPADLPAIQALIHAAYSPYIARIGQPPGPMLDDYAALLTSPHAHVHVALHPSTATICGLIVLIPQPSDGTLLLDNIAVAPSAQGLGIGRALLDFAEGFARQRGLGAITLYTNEAMAENLAIYAKRGYVETHRAEEKGFRRVYMRKELGGA